MGCFCTTQDANLHVGQLIAMAVESGRKTLPGLEAGIRGEHGGAGGDSRETNRTV